MKERVKKGLKVFFKLIYLFLIVLCVLLIAVIFIQKLTGDEKSLEGYRIFIIESGSMSPKYDIGEVILCKEVQSEVIQVGDSIVYKGMQGDLAGKLIMHEVVEISTNDQNQKIYKTRGIANNIEDPDVSFSQVYGKVLFKSKVLTYLFEIANNKYISLFIFAILVLNVFINFYTGKKDKYLKISDSTENENEVDKISKNLEELDGEEKLEDNTLESSNLEEIKIEENKLDETSKVSENKDFKEENAKEK